RAAGAVMRFDTATPEQSAADPAACRIDAGTVSPLGSTFSSESGRPCELHDGCTAAAPGERV
ncbi:MAG: hypothetical protein U1A78_41090, partial [Polyangia bacterium]